MDRAVSEYMMLYLFEPKNLRCGYIRVSPKDYSGYNLSVDTPEDLDRTKLLLQKLKPATPQNVQLQSLLDEIDENPALYPLMPTDTPLKYPYDKIISYQEYLDDMKRRYAGSVETKASE